MGNNITVIDFALSEVRIIYGYFLQGKIYVLQSLESSSLPLDDNGLLASKETKGIINMLLEQIAKSTKGNIDMVIPLYPAYNFQVKQTAGTVTTMDQRSQITPHDFVNCCNMINKENKDKSMHIIYNEPIKFLDDYKREFIELPVGVTSDHLSTVCYSHLIDSNIYEHYKNIINDLNLNVYFELCSPVASSMFINFFDAPSDYVILEIEKDYSYISRIINKHLVETKFTKFGVKNIIENACNILKIDYKKGIEYLNLFGLYDNSEFKYQTSENLTIRKINEAFRNSFSQIIDLMNNYYNLNNIPNETPIILHGIGGDINSITSFLTHQLSKNVKLFSPLVIGARSKNYVSALGALRASDFSYQLSIEDARKKGNTNSIHRNKIYRGE